eukprot:1143836-Pelagomonas_calceolata.AAC.5
MAPSAASTHVSMMVELRHRRIFARHKAAAASAAATSVAAATAASPGKRASDGKDFQHQTQELDKRPLGADLINFALCQVLHGSECSLISAEKFCCVVQVGGDARGNLCVKLVKAGPRKLPRQSSLNKLNAHAQPYYAHKIFVSRPVKHSE